MKKEIVINASKDRARIAIVEDGELVELYVEHPDNVRTLGNIYLGKVAKVMPQIHAAFVDIGQRQDAFLHFSDLTDNAAQLFAIAGMDVPGLESGPILAKAPKKRVADDDSEPDVEETLEVEETAEESNTSRSRSRRRRRRRGGRGRRGGRSRSDNNSTSEEEEEQEERRLPHVIDLTQKTGSVRPSRKAKDESPEEPEAPEPLADDASEAEAKEDKPKRRRSRKKPETPAEEAPAGDSASEPEAPQESAGTSPEEAPAPDAAENDEQKEDKPKRRRSRSRSRKKKESAETPAASDDEHRQPTSEAADSPEAEADTPARKTKALPPTIDLTSKPTPSRRKRSEDDEEADEKPKRSRRRSRSADEASADDGEAADREESSDEGEKPKRSRRSRSRSKSTDAETSADDAAETKDTDDAKDANDDGRSRRSRRGRGRSTASDRSDDADTDASEDSDEQKGRSRRRSRSDNSRSDNSRSGKGSSERDSGSGEKSANEKGSRSRDKDSKQSSRGGRGRNDNGKGSGSSKGKSAQVPDKPEELLKRGERVLVKITKEPISSKGSRVSTDISLAGRFLVLVPAADYVAVSKKIASAKERRRLRTLATSLKPDNFGVIVRTVAEGREAKVLDQDLRLLVDKWRTIEKKLEGKPEPPVLLYEDVNMVSSIVRDLFTEDYDRILVDDPRLHKNLQSYVKAVAPQMADRVVLHKGNQPVYRSAGLEKQVAEAFSERVNMKGGGYLIIEHTEAMHVVDVNSGRAGRGKRRAEENLLNVNVEAAREIAKQLRLRDLGGIICVDFIDLRYERDRRKVTEAIKKEFAKDRAVTKVIGMSDFGVMQITRQRLRPSITTQADDDADALEAMAAAGAAEIPQPERRRRRAEDSAPETTPDDAPAADPAADTASAPDAPRPRRRSRRTVEEDISPAELAERIRAWLTHYRDIVDERYAKRPIVVGVHPLLGSYLRRGFPSPLTRWRFRLRNLPFRLEDDAKVDPLAFTVRDQKSGRSLLSKYTLEG